MPKLEQPRLLPVPAPPDVLSALNHALRWQMLAYLRLSDLRVSELAELTGTKLNSVSYHLRILREAGLVEVRRSDGDARDNYYQLHHQSLTNEISTLLTGLHLRNTHPEALPTLPALDVLALCTHNSARSQMTEGFLRAMSNNRLRIASAGTKPTTLHPEAVRAMQAHDIDISAHTSTHVQTLIGQHFDVVITVCDNGREECPTFPSNQLTLHWSLNDPARVPTAEQPAAFDTTARELLRRVQTLLPVLATMQPSSDG
jgi:ArsR family transcriptional regulator, arsenate/arsenite/antimonite-responsive transcriptional repressor / arsenate reductase (thioredoxin)